MKYKVVGYRPCDFLDDNGKPVKGVSLKCYGSPEDDSVVGEDIYKIWLPEELIKEVGFVPDVGTTVDLKYEVLSRNKIKLVGYALVTADNTFSGEGG